MTHWRFGWCEGCGLKPPAYRQRRFCYDCKPGSKGRPRPCRKCGSTKDYWTERLCRRCHQYAPQHPEPCRDCFAWGARRPQKWLCQACIGWRAWYPTLDVCISCDRELHVNPHGACRLCWRQAKLVQERLRGRRRGELDIIEFNRHGQQLFFANMGSSKNGYRPPQRPDQADIVKVPWVRPRRVRTQLDLFIQDWLTTAFQRRDINWPRQLAHANKIDALVVDHAARHGWRSQKTHNVRVAARWLVTNHVGGDGRFNVSDANGLVDLQLPVRPLLAVLDEADLLDDDRPATIEVWFDRKVRVLPDPMSKELRVWFDVLHRGSSTPPRRRPRSPITIKSRLNWALPTLVLWAAAGHESLREISREDILTVLPGSGTPRATLGAALRSIFTTLKQRKLIFYNPMARMSVGNPERRIPLPADPSRLRLVLNAPDPTARAIAALVIYHGLRPVEVRHLQLTDVRDGQVHLPDRVIPLAQPVTRRLTDYLDERHRRWPTSVNPHLFIHILNAGGTHAATSAWVTDRVGTPASQLRAARIVDEVLATGGDLRRVCDFFGVTMTTAEHYAQLLDNPDLTETLLPDSSRSS